MSLKYKVMVYGGALFLVLCFFYVICSNGKLINKINYYRGAYEEQKKITIASEQVTETVIKEQKKKIAELNGAIDSANAVIARLQQGQDDADETISDLNGRLALAKTDTDRVPILTAMVEGWRTKYNNAVLVIAEKDKIIFSLTEKYESQVRITTQYIVDWKNEKALNKTAEIELNLMGKRIGSLQRQVKARNIVDVLLVAGALYLALK